MRPSIHTDAYEDGTVYNPPMIFLAGPIKHWWSKCTDCFGAGATGIEGSERFPRTICENCQGTAEMWGSKKHVEYINWRNHVRSKLIDWGYLTYAPWDAIKGTWNPRAQSINDMAIAQSDLMIVLTPTDLPLDAAMGTAEEIDYAEKVKTPVMYFPPGTDYQFPEIPLKIGYGKRWND